MTPAIREQPQKGPSWIGLTLGNLQEIFIILIYDYIAIQELSAEVLFQFYIALDTSKHFCTYFYFSLACFSTTYFGTCPSMCITLNIPFTGLHFCICLLVIHIIFPSLQYSTLLCSFCSNSLYILYLPFVSNHFFFNHFKVCTTQDVS